MSAAAPVRALRAASARRSVWPLLAALVLAALLGDLLLQVHDGLAAPARSDWLPFATGGRLLASDPTCLYCPPAQASTQAGILGYVPAAGFPKPFVNPPLTALLLRPLASLPLAMGMALFVGVLLAVLVACWRVGVSLLPASWSPAARGAVIGAVVLSIPGATALGLAQWAPLLLLAALLALVALRRDRPVLSGLLLAVLLVKPQTVWLVVPLLAAARSWRVLLGFALGAAAWVGSALVLVGPRQLAQWPALVLAQQGGEAHRTVGLPGWVAELGGGDRGAFVAAVVLGLLVCAGAWLLRAQLRGRAQVAVALGIGLSLLASPHVFPDDLMLLGAVVAVWAPLAPRRAVGLSLALSLAYLLDGWLPLPLAHTTTSTLAAVACGAAWGLLRGNRPVVTRSHVFFGLVIEPAGGG